MRRIILILIAVLSLSIVATAQADVPVSHGKPFSCPDPSTVNYKGFTYMACTTDFNTSAFDIYRSRWSDGHNWTFVTHIFNNSRPTWANPNARAWAPDLVRINNQWVVYFAMEAQVWGNTNWAIGVATSSSIYGPWQSHELHYQGQFPGTQETYAGVIDPGEAQAPNGQRYIVWAEQPDRIWIAPLTSDGQYIQGQTIDLALQAQPTDCDPSGGCCIEGPALLFHGNTPIILYSDKSTWNGTYSMRYAYAMSDNPMGQWVSPTNYIVAPNSGWYNTGGGQTPVPINHRLTLFFHGTPSQNDQYHISNQRLVLSARFAWNGDAPVVSPIGESYHTVMRHYYAARKAQIASARNRRRKARHRRYRKHHR